MRVRHLENLGLLFLLAACERDRTPEPKPAPRDAGVPEPAKCELADDKIELGHYLELQFHGKVFAGVRKVQHVEVHVTEQGITASATTELATLAGDADRKAIQVRPRKEERLDGWLAIHGATLGGKTADPAELVFDASSLVVFEHPPSARFACKDLTLAIPSEHSPDGREAWLRRDKTSPIAREPKGKPFAQLVVPPAVRHPRFPEPPPSVWSLGERDGWTEVIIGSSDADVRGWIPSDALAPQNLAMADLLTGFGDMSRKPKLQSCPNAMPIYVRDGETTAQVGTTIAGAKLTFVRTTADAIVLDLGAEPDPFFGGFVGPKPPPHLQPFVRRADAAGCKPVK